MEEIVYFELNNWFCGRDYPNAQPFIDWMANDLKIRFNNDSWVKENCLCVKKSYIDMSQNFCITAKKSWVEKNCPKLLTEYRKYLREPDEDGDVYGKFGDVFLPYEDYNIGIAYSEED